MKPASELGSTDTAEIVVHGAFLPRLETWVKGEGFELRPWPGPGDDDPESGYHSFVLVPSRELVERVASATANVPEGAMPESTAAVILGDRDRLIDLRERFHGSPE